MKFACEKCGHVNEVEAQQNRAAKSRWSGMTKQQRAYEMSRIRKKGVKNQKRTARRSNDQAQRPLADSDAGRKGKHE